MLKYKVIDKQTGQDAGDDCIVTPGGAVSWWDESQGWAEDELQSRYEVRLLEYTISDATCSHKTMVNSIGRDRLGNLFACATCGMRTKDRVHWRQPNEPR